MGGSPALIVDRAALSADDVAVDFSIPVQATLSGADPDGGNPFEPPVLDLTLTSENSTAFIREDIKLRAVGETVDADFRALRATRRSIARAFGSRSSSTCRMSARFTPFAPCEALRQVE